MTVSFQVLCNSSFSNHPTILCKIEVFTAVTMKKAVFWDVSSCRNCVNRRFGGTYCLHLQGRKMRELGTSVNRWDLSSLQQRAHAGSSLADFPTLKMEAIFSSETSVYTISTRRHIPEDGFLHPTILPM
jgi:hypothetical protein